MVSADISLLDAAQKFLSDKAHTLLLMDVDPPTQVTHAVLSMLSSHHLIQFIAANVRRFKHF
jgi:hypothetical protein